MHSFLYIKCSIVIEVNSKINPPNYFDSLHYFVISISLFCKNNDVVRDEDYAVINGIDLDFNCTSSN